MILIGSLALVGLPFLTGFYSKDCILEIAASSNGSISNLCYFLGCAAAFCTSFYSFRLAFLTFLNPTNSFKTYLHSAHEAPIKMIMPLIILGFGSIFYGFFTRDLMIGLGSLFFNSVSSGYSTFQLIDSEFLNIAIKNIPFIFTIFGIIFSLFLINCSFVNKLAVMNLKLSQPFKLAYTFLNKK
jgi:NADH-ubiquinone oxidoreductase chain 5